MSDISHITSFKGSCHCGNIGMAFETLRKPAQFNPRACDCSFCQKHGVAYISDPLGKLHISIRNGAALKEYRQGSKSARFLLCNDCGVCIGTVFDHENSTYGAINARCLDSESGFGDTLPASPRKLATNEKISRWLELWIPDVIITPLDA